MDFPDAGPIWARFYEIGSNRPVFVGRDGVVKYSVAEIEPERRVGYACTSRSLQNFCTTNTQSGGTGLTT